ncbi:MAG: hypothetical protein A2V98_06200 [Planctomycetes bacterium RBG_16_64_12]|nr:MAG: hypothetical protein A2V98_06200 [Planctomycetes bacterium RBG_16_64_12]
MFDSEPADEFVRRPQGSSCLILGMMGVVSVFLAIVTMAVVGSVLFPDFGKLVGREGPADHPAVGRKLPQLELESLSGAKERVTLESLAGKVAMVNFWGTWCGPCLIEAPDLAALGGKLRPEPDFRLLAVSCGKDIPEDADALRQETGQFLAELGLDMPTYVDPDGATRQAFFSLGGKVGLPTTFVLDRRGVIRNVWQGYGRGTSEQMEQWILRLLEEPA